ncbi:MULTISPECIES: helix-turn-helix transcriptional regulator [Clostridia]|uniref:WYL domain-containing protein n=3 Tax=Clostridia TaxID=186801 RepID=A0A8I0AAA0_9CLOT|nr:MULTISPECIES: WYL domain-containing protein [Clostridia]MBC5641087.1 WYL domain-containing protein [Clostridium lentum]MBC5653727.1 WYL domain-containing protein [Blautia lenta]
MRLRRAVFLLEILKKKTNNSNKLTINELIEELKNEGYNVTRNTVKSDINSLIDSGYNIIETKARYNTSCYHYESEFSIEECRVILDSLYSNKFIRNDYKRNIKEKILSNISYIDRAILRNLVITETIDTGGIDVTRNLFDLHKAIIERKTIEFINTTRDANKKIIEKKKVECFIPKKIYYYNNRYYLIGFNEIEEIRHYRIDRLSKIIIKEFHDNKENIDLKDYGLINFDMFRAEKVERVELKVNKSLINSVIEKFGDRIDIHRCLEDGDYFIISTFVGINTGLVRWILKQGAEAKVIYPEYLIEKLKVEIEKVQNLYK